VGAREAFRHLVASWGKDDLIECAFDLREYQPWDELSLGPLQLRFREVPHFIRTFAVEITGSSGARLTFGADCSPNHELVEFARGTDLLLIEGTLPRPERTGERGHLTPFEAGEHGRRAQAKRLVVTHFSDEMDADWVRAQAGEAFGGPVELAHEGAVYTV
jgi:ribonuclease BN (tRNA processing enzyme)